MICLTKSLEEVNKDLNDFLNKISSGKSLSVNRLRKFIVDYQQLDVAEIHLFTAFKTDPKEIFYQSQDSETWLKLK